MKIITRNTSYLGKEFFYDYKFLSTEERIIRNVQLMADYDTGIYKISELARKYELSRSRVYQLIKKRLRKEKFEKENKAHPYSLNMSVRTINCLLDKNIKNLITLSEYSPRQLLKIRNFGKVSLEEVKSKLAEVGLSLKRNVCPCCKKEI